MDLWTQWLAGIRFLLTLLSSHTGLGTGMGIVVLTVLLRSAILPLSWSIGYRGAIRQKKMACLQPRLKLLKDQFSDQPHIYGERMMALYREQGIRVIDGRSLFGALIQMPLFLGMYQSLRAGVDGARFLWAETLSRPDPWFALLAGITTLLVMLANPDLPEPTRLMLVLIPSVLAFVVALKFCSALAVYGIASNCYSAAQMHVLHYIVARRIRSGAVKI
jgi:YidC/Oxa1 family membrane protein insertase